MHNKKMRLRLAVPPAALRVHAAVCGKWWPTTENGQSRDAFSIFASRLFIPVVPVVPVVPKVTLAKMKKTGKRPIERLAARSHSRLPKDLPHRTFGTG